MYCDMKSLVVNPIWTTFPTTSVSFTVVKVHFFNTHGHVRTMLYSMQDFVGFP